MHVRHLVATTFAALSAAAPATEAKKPYIAVSLFLHYDPPDSFSYQSPAPMELYHFANYHKQKYVVKMDFEHDYAFGVDINAVECQAYADALGQHPIGTFTNKHALVFDQPTTVGSGICYAVPA